MNTLLDALIEQGKYIRKYTGNAGPLIAIPTGEILDDKMKFEKDGHKFIYVYDPELDENYKKK